MHTAEVYIEPPDMIEIELAIDKLKNNKAPGYDLIPAELIKKGGLELKQSMLHLMLTMGDRDSTARMENWSHSTNSQKRR